MDIANCDTCGPHLDRIRAELLPLMTAPVPLHATPDELVDRLMYRITPHLHAAVEAAEGTARAVVPRLREFRERASALNADYLAGVDHAIEVVTEMA